MPDPFNKFNSKSGFELNIDNVVSKIRLDFDTNVSSPNNYILGINAEQDEFVLIDPNLINNTNQTENTFDLAILGNNMLGKVNHYVFEKLVDPSIVGCSNCDSSTNIKSQFIDTGSLPIINREVIAEFEVNPNAVHSLEIELVGHRKICDENGNCFDNWSSEQNLQKQTLVTDTRALSDMLNTNRTAQFSFIDYSCCKCCDAFALYQNGSISEAQAKTLCENSNQFILVDSIVVPDFYSYCTTQNLPYYDELNTTLEQISVCRLIEKTKENYGSGVNPDLYSCSASPEKLKISSLKTTRSPPSCPCGVDEETGECKCCIEIFGLGSLCCCAQNNPDNPGASCCPGTCCKFDSIQQCEQCILEGTCCLDGGTTPEPTTTDAPPPPQTTTTTSAPPPQTTTTTTTSAPPPQTTTTTTTSAPTTSAPTTQPPQPGWSCIGPDDCVQDDTSDCFDETTCCATCDEKWICNPDLALPGGGHSCMIYTGTNPCGRPIYDTLQECQNAPSSEACSKTYDCIFGVCEEIIGCLGEFSSMDGCINSQKCGRYVCKSSVQTCQPCEFVKNTSIGYTTLEECNTKSKCNKPTYNCNGITCPDGREIQGTCEEVCAGGEYSSLSQCVNSGCELEDFGPRFRCNNKVCEWVSPCDDPNPQQFFTRDECKLSCGDFNCRNNVCTREEGSGQYPTLENCVGECECVVFLNLTGSSTGCSECQLKCGPAKRIENGGSCIGCDSLGRSCSSCRNKFDSIVECEIFRQNNDLIPHTCTGSTCIPTSSIGSTFENCGNYCSRSECQNVCSVPSGYNCVRDPVSLSYNCQPDYCGRGEFRTFTECKDNCSTPLSCGFNCVPNRLNPRVNECRPACGAETDEGAVGGSGVGEFQTLSMCKAMCLTDLGWTCKGNNCVRATAVDGPGQYETYKECVERCIIPNQAPCGVAPRVLRT